MQTGATVVRMALTLVALLLLGEGPVSAWNAEAAAPPAHVPWRVRHELNRAEAILRRGSARLSPELQVLRGTDVVVLRIPARLLFNPDSDQLRPALRAAEVLALPITLLRQRRRLMTRIEVYSDNIGGQQMNADLSAKRATTLGNALLSAGIAARRVQAYGRGFAQALAANDTAEGRMLNRRVEFTFARVGSAAASAGIMPAPAAGPAGG